MTTDRDMPGRPSDPFAKRAPAHEADAFTNDALIDGGAPRQSETSERRPDMESGREARAGTATIANAASTDHEYPSLLEAGESDDLRSRWERCQQHFVDEPKASVKSADELVAEVMQKVAQQFVVTREGLERQWDRGDDVSTEDLRLAMQKYREFFNRLLAA